MTQTKWPLMQQAITWSDKLQLIKFLLLTDRLTNGPKVRQFEQEWNTWLGSKHSLMTSSGSTANFLLLAAVKEKYGLNSGDKVLVPACTWVTNIAPVIQLGLTPIFCDINLSNFSFDINHMKAVALKHPDIKLIFVTHLLGFPADNLKYKEIFPNALILDDVCESHGCENLPGVKVGSNSLGATFSFYFGHHITTIEGGMISTNDSELFDLMRMKRSHGLSRESNNRQKWEDQYPNIHPQFLFVSDGYNFRSSEINAVLGLNQLKRLDSIVQTRKQNFSRFVKLINNLPNKFVSLVDDPGNSSFCFPFICHQQSQVVKLKALFDKQGVEHRPIVGGNLLKQPFLSQYGFDPVPSSNTINVDMLHSNGLYIGNNHFISNNDMDWLEEVIRNDI